MEKQLQLRTVKYMKDAYIIVEGQRNANQFFIIREGKVRLSKEVVIVEEEKDTILGPGDFFAVVSTMSGHSHIEAAQALTETLLVAVQKEQFSQLIQNNASVAKKILLEFSKRIRSLNESLTKLALKKTSSVDIDHLFTVAEYYARQRQFNSAHYVYNQYIKHCPDGNNVQKAQERLQKIASSVKGARTNFAPDELTRSYPKNTIIFSEAEPGEEVFIIKSGLVKIAKVAEDEEILLAVLKAGDVFGEMALLESRPRTASATAYDDCELMVVNRSNFNQMITNQPQLIARMIILLAERIWLSYKQLANTRITDSMGRMLDMLLVQLEKRHVDLDTKQTYQLDFGVTELISMVGFTQNEGKVLVQKLLQNRSINIVMEKICVENVSELARQAAYYSKIHERTRRS